MLYFVNHTLVCKITSIICGYAVNFYSTQLAAVFTCRNICNYIWKYFGIKCHPDWNIRHPFVIYVQHYQDIFYSWRTCIDKYIPLIQRRIYQERFKTITDFAQNRKPFGSTLNILFLYEPPGLEIIQEMNKFKIWFVRTEWSVAQVLNKYASLKIQLLFSFEISQVAVRVSSVFDGRWLTRCFLTRCLLTRCFLTRSFLTRCF